MSITNEERKYLLSRMEWVLDDNRYDYSESALNKIIDVWAQNKGALIEAFKRHPNYIEGKFMIAFDSDYDRDIDYAKLAFIDGLDVAYNDKINNTIKNKKLFRLILSLYLHLILFMQLLYPRCHQCVHSVYSIIFRNC